MVLAVKKLLYLLKAKMRKARQRNKSLPVDRLIEAILSGDPDGLLQGPSFDLSPFERWVLLEKGLRGSRNPVLHFLHVPKTGGTTLTAALAADRRFLVVSVDGPPDVFIRQIRGILESRERKLVFIRAHHGWSLVRQSGAAGHVDFAFTTIREPAAIHASNANMIVRRIQRLVGGQSQSQEEREYATRWLDIMQGRHGEDSRFAVEILSTPEYRREMGGVYSTMFDVPDWKDDVLGGRLLCIDMEQLDRFFAEGFGYVQPPPRKNVSTDGPLATDQIPAAILDPLIDPDLEIFRFLSESKVAPEQAVARLRALMES